VDHGVQVEWLILADAAQVVANKLFLLGGGWEVLTVNSGFPVQRHCAVAASFRVPWNETNQPHDLEIEIDDEDGHELFKVAGQVEVGRPAGIPIGQPQRAQMAADIALTFDHAGTYVVIGRVNGQESRRVQFSVMAGPGLTGAKPGEKRGA